jgi:dUTP pyrophosphatase
MLKFQKVRDVKSPCYGTIGSAGLDVFIPNDRDKQTLNIEPHESIIIKTGLKFDIPTGYALIAMNKSGVATKLNLQVGACVIDEDYTGEPSIHLFNVSNFKVKLKPGQKITQFLLIPYLKPKLIEVDNINKKTERGDKGFGSTDIINKHYHYVNFL